MNNMNVYTKSSVILIISLLSGLISIGQKTKVYDGKYESGSARYYYYEDEKLNRIYHGDFLFNSEIGQLKGYFENGKRQGRWTIDARSVEYKDFYTKYKLNTKIAGEFMSGLFNGDWAYSHKYLPYSYMERRYTENENYINCNASFNNGIFTKSITYYSYYIYKSKKYESIIKGQFCENGLLDGVWTYDSERIEERVKFLNGVPYYALKREKSTGDIIFYYTDSLNFVHEFWNNYNENSDYSIVNGELYYTDTIEIWPNIFYRFFINNPDVFPNLQEYFTDQDEYFDFNVFRAIYMWNDYDNNYERNPLFNYKKGISSHNKAYLTIIRKCKLVDSNCYREPDYLADLDSLKFYYENKNYEKVVYLFNKARNFKVPEKEYIDKYSYSLNEIANNYSNIAKNLYNEGKYEESIIYSEKAIKYRPHTRSSSDDTNRIRNAKRKLEEIEYNSLLEFKLDSIKEIAESYFYDQNFHMALLQYEEMRKLNENRSFRNRSSQEKYDKIIYNRIKVCKIFSELKDAHNEINTLYIKGDKYLKKDLYFAYLLVYSKIIEKEEIDFKESVNISLIQSKMKRLIKQRTGRLERRLRRAQTDEIDKIMEIIINY